MRFKGISKKIISYICITALTIGGLGGVGSMAQTAKAASLPAIVLDGDAGESSAIGDYSWEGGYKYMGFVTFKDFGDNYSDYRYLSITYTGSAKFLRLEFMDVVNDESGGTYWLNPYQGSHLITTEGNDVDFETFKTEPTTIVIDLKAMVEEGEPALDISKYKGGMHMHNGDGSLPSEECSMNITDARFTTGIPGQESVEDIILNGDIDGQSSMIKSWSVNAAYKYLGFATLKEATADYKYFILTYAGDISTIRYEFAYVDDKGNETAKSEAYWFNKEGQAKFFVTADESDIPLDGGKGTTVVIDLEKTGIDLTQYNSVHIHSGYGGTATAFSFTIGMARLSAEAVTKDVDKMSQQVETTTQKTTQVSTTKPEVPTESKTTKVSKPKKTKIVKINTKKKTAKKVKVSLKKVNKVKGYQIQFSITKKFKKVLVSKNVKKVTTTVSSAKLKNKKKLYVRARAYNLNGKKKVYGDWSKVKSVKIKK